MIFQMNLRVFKNDQHKENADLNQTIIKINTRKFNNLFSDYEKTYNTFEGKMKMASFLK